MSPRPVTDTPSASASSSPVQHAAFAAMEKWLPAYIVILVLIALSLLCSVALIVCLFRKHRPRDSARPSGPGVVTTPYGPPQHMHHGGGTFELLDLGDQAGRSAHAPAGTSTGSRPGSEHGNRRPVPAGGAPSSVQTPPRSRPATGYNCHRHPARPSLHEILSRPSDKDRRRYPPGVNPYTMEIKRSTSPRVSSRSSDVALTEGRVAEVKPGPAAAAASVPPSPAATECNWKEGEVHHVKPRHGMGRKEGWMSRRRSSMRKLGGESTRERL